MSQPALSAVEDTTVDSLLGSFLERTRFCEAGAVVTDLDGTAVHEHEGRIAIPKTVSHGLTHLRELGRPVVINTLRFPLNVIRTFGREWYSISNAPLPLVSLNGSLVGHLHETAGGEIGFEERLAFPMTDAEIEAVLATVESLLAGGIREVVLFYYPREWTAGEIIWTPLESHVAGLRQKYASASEVFAGTTEQLRERLARADICMILLLVEAPGDRLMAYQHVRPSSFATRAGVDKLFGAREVAGALGIDLAHCVGAGDTPMDNFLEGVGLAVHVGPLQLDFRGRVHTLRVRDSLELGELLFRLADLQRARMARS